MTFKAWLGSSVLMAFMTSITAVTSPQQNGVALEISSSKLPFVEVVINGKQVKALVDTGSFRSLEVSERLADELKLATTGSGDSSVRYAGASGAVSTVAIKTAGIGSTSLPITSAEVVPGDIPRIASQIKVEFDAILGFGLLSKFQMVIDYPNHRFELREPRATIEGTPAHRWSFDTRNQAPVIAATVNGTLTNVLFDTGAPTCNVDPSRVEGAALGTMVPTKVIIGQDSAEWSCRVKDLTPIKRGLDATAVIGTTVLERYRVVVDPALKIVLAFE